MVCKRREEKEGSIGVHGTVIIMMDWCKSEKDKKS